MPPSEAEKTLIDKVAQYVAKNGDGFEEMMKKKQTGNQEYDFLSPGGQFHQYYQTKLRAEKIAYKFNQQREAATQAAKDAVAQSHQGGGNFPWSNPNAAKPITNKWNPTLKIGGWQNPNAGGGAWNRTSSPAFVNNDGGWKQENREKPPVTESEMKKLKEEYYQKKTDFETKIRESEGNLKEQRKSLMTDRENRVDEVIEEKLIFECTREALKLDLNLDEFHRILRPIVKHCTKEAIATGKAWILQNGPDLIRARLICKYISARVLSNSATFDMRLHTIYLINDVLHHANRKNNKTVLTAFEEIIVPLWSVAKLRADKVIGERLSKLKDLWKQNAYFSHEVEKRFDSHIVEYKQFRDDLRDRFSEEVKKAEDEFDSQFKDFEKQHGEYVSHTEEVIKELEKNIRKKEILVKDWEKKMEKKKEEEQEMIKKNKEGLENYKKELSARAQLNTHGQNTNFGPMGKKWEGAEDGLIPNRSYYELPAGLMASCIPLEQKPFTPIDPKKLRLVPHIQPSKKLLQALDEFYRPLGPHIPIKDNWIHGSLDKFFEAKNTALEDKKEKKTDEKSERRKSDEQEPDQKRPKKSRFSFSEVKAR